MNAKQLFVAALTQATAVVDAVQQEDFGKPTPEPQQSVQALAGNMLYELCWVPDMVQGSAMDTIGDAYEGDLIGDALQANWHAAAERAYVAAVATSLSLDGTVHTSEGVMTVDAYLRQVGAKLLIHAWDLGEGIGMPVYFDTALTTAVNEYLLPHIKTWQQAGVFGPTVTIPKMADAQTKLLALTGRRVNWPSM